MNKNVGIYLRLSKEDRDKQNIDVASESIKNQRYIVYDYIKKHPNFKLIDEYVDEDFSGIGSYRPEFERLIRDCKNKRINIVLCKSQSRFSRDMEVIEKYIHNKFREWGVRFIGVSDNADTDIIGNKKARQINGLVNEWYLEDISSNIRSAFGAKMLRGELIAPFAPFGYEIDRENKTLVIDKVASLIVKKIFALYIDGYGYLGIAKYLNDKFIPSPSLYKYNKNIKLNIVSKRKREDIKWNSSAVKNILTNEVYLGNLIQGKRTTISYKNHKIIKKKNDTWIRVNNTHENIIDIDTFNKVKELMKERKRVSREGLSIHNFSGKVFCRNCYSYMKKKCSSKYSYLVCSNTQDSYHECFNNKSIRYDVLEELVLGKINKLVKGYFDEEILNSELSKYNCDDDSDNIKLFEYFGKDIYKRLEEIDNYLKNTYEDKVNGVIDNELFKELSLMYYKEKEVLNNKINELKKRKDMYYKNIEQKVSSKEVFYKYKEFKYLSRVIVQEFIDKIYIGGVRASDKTREIYIKWNF